METSHEKTFIHQLFLLVKNVILRLNSLYQIKSIYLISCETSFIDKYDSFYDKKNSRYCSLFITFNLSCSENKGFVLWF